MKISDISVHNTNENWNTYMNVTPLCLPMNQTAI